MDKTVKINARAKINLSLKVLGKREDGYHELDSAMQSVTLCDVLTFKRIGKKDYLKVISDSRFLPTDDRNIVYRAVEFMLNEYGIRKGGEGVFAGIEKRIPVSAGLGGGSADCAAAITGVDLLFGLGLSDAEKAAIGLSFGADVPFCLTGGSQKAGGIGEKLVKLETNNNNAYTLLVKPPVSVSTADIFGRLNLSELQQNNNQNENYIYNGNDLEAVTCAIYPIISEVKAFLSSSGAFYAAMTGTGPTVFGLFKHKRDAENTFISVKKQFPHINEIFLTNFADSGLQIL